jgi:hypothetical protein
MKLYNPPQAGYGKNFCVKWLNIINGETMYSGAMTQEAAQRLIDSGCWHSRAFPAVQELKTKGKPNP